jgi:hypothetical protein
MTKEKNLVQTGFLRFWLLAGKKKKKKIRGWHVKNLANLSFVVVKRSTM